MTNIQIRARPSKDIHLATLSEASGKNIKIKLGLVELIFQGLILLLLV